MEVGTAAVPYGKQLVTVFLEEQKTDPAGVHAVPDVLGLASGSTAAATAEALR